MRGCGIVTHSSDTLLCSRNCWIYSYHIESGLQLQKNQDNLSWVICNSKLCVLLYALWILFWPLFYFISPLFSLLMFPKCFSPIGLSFSLLVLLLNCKRFVLRIGKIQNKHGQKINFLYQVSIPSEINVKLFWKE